jgi:hypothetical protein
LWHPRCNLYQIFLVYRHKGWKYSKCLLSNYHHHHLLSKDWKRTQCKCKSMCVSFCDRCNTEQKMKRKKHEFEFLSNPKVSKKTDVNCQCKVSWCSIFWTKILNTEIKNLQSSPWKIEYRTKMLRFVILLTWICLFLSNSTTKMMEFYDTDRPLSFVHMPKASRWFNFLIKWNLLIRKLNHLELNKLLQCNN